MNRYRPPLLPLSASVLLTAFAVCLIGSCRAQQIVLKTGQVVPAQNLKREGTQLISNVEVAGRVGAVGYDVANIDHLEIPKPAAMLQAEQALIAGNFAAALAGIELVVNAEFPFRDIKGNYWAPSLLLKSNALLGLNRGKDATSFLTQLSFADEPNIALTAKARLAGILALGGKEKAREAVQLANDIVVKSNNRGVLAEAYLAKGRALFAQDNYPDALLAFLHLPVFYDQQPVSTAAAMMGSARCYMAMGDTRRGVRSYLELEEQYPTLPEARAAKAEIEKGGPRIAALVTELKNEKEESEKQFQGLASTEPEKKTDASTPAP